MTTTNEFSIFSNSDGDFLSNVFETEESRRPLKNHANTIHNMARDVDFLKSLETKLNTLNNEDILSELHTTSNKLSVIIKDAETLSLEVGKLIKLVGEVEANE